MMIRPKAASSRQAILDAAYALFLEQGFSATSMRQIARRAGLALGGIYNHFPGKEAIFSEVLSLHHPYHRVLPVLLQTPFESPEQFVRCAARTMLEELEGNPDFLKLMLIEIVEFGGRNLPAILQNILPQVESLLQRIEQHAEALRPFSPFTLLRAFLGLFFSYYITDFLIVRSRFVGARQEALDDFVEIFLHGILAERPVS